MGNPKNQAPQETQASMTTNIPWTVYTDDAPHARIDVSRLNPEWIEWVERELVYRATWGAEYPVPEPAMYLAAVGP